MDKIIRWGLLSTARINRRLIPAIRASARSTLAAVASRNPATARDYAAEWQIPVAFGSYEEMLASDKVDAVYISLPNALHAEWSIRAMQAGKHVLCEKPFAISVQEVDNMITVSQATGMVIAEAFMYRHHPQTKLVMDWVHSGRLGQIVLVSGEFTFKLDRDADIRLLQDQSGGSLFDVGVYPVSYAQAVYGSPPQSVFGSSTLGPSGVDLSFAAQMQYSSNQTAQFFCSFDVPYQMRIEIFGTMGHLYLTRPFAGVEEVTSFVYTPVDGDPVQVPFPTKELYLCEVEDMEAAILDGKPGEVSLSQSRDHIRTVEALFASARTGLPQKLSD